MAPGPRVGPGVPAPRRGQNLDPVLWLFWAQLLKTMFLSGGILRQVFAGFNQI